MTLARYRDYAESGLPWLGPIPAHWKVRRLKNVATVVPSNVDKKSYEGEEPIRLCNYTDVYYNEQITAALPFMAASATRDQVGKFTLRSGDTLITKDSETADDIAVAAYIPEDLPGVVCGYHLAIVRPTHAADGRFIKRVFDSQYLKSSFAVRANGLTRVGLSQHAIATVFLPLPPLDEQRTIANFLDRETAKIDALITEQEKLIALLAEKRQSTISLAVTRGLSASVQTKDVDLSWLGKIPSHWRVVKLKALAEVQTGIAKGKDVTGKKTIQVPYLRVANVQDGYLDLSEIATIEIEPEQLERYRLQPGDVLMNEGGDFDKLGRGTVWNGEISECIHQNHVFAVRPRFVSAAWLSRVIGSGYAQFYFMSRSKQSTNLASISSTNIMELPVVMPPDAEQASILRFIEIEEARLQALQTHAELAISLLRERRSVLITAAVTGQIDVRDSVPHPAAEPERLAA